MDVTLPKSICHYLYLNKGIICTGISLLPGDNIQVPSHSSQEKCRHPCDPPGQYQGEVTVTNVTNTITNVTVTTVTNTHYCYCH